MAPYDHSAKLFKTLSHPTRLAILDLLRDGEACVCHLEAALGYRQAYISQHLMVLRDAGLVGDRREGSNVYYHVTERSVFEVLNAVQSLDGLAAPDPRARLAGCPCPKCAAQAVPARV